MPYMYLYMDMKVYVCVCDYAGTNRNNDRWLSLNLCLQQHQQTSTVSKHAANCDFSLYESTFDRHCSFVGAWMAKLQAHLKKSPRIHTLVSPCLSWKPPHTRHKTTPIIIIIIINLFNLQSLVGNLKNEKRVLQWLIDQKSKTVPYCTSNLK